MMDFIEYVGDFRVITKGDIQVFNGESVKLQLHITDNDSPLIMLFDFVEDKERRGEVVKDINERTLTWTIYYYKEILSYTIIANPIIIGTEDRKSVV